MHEEHIFAAEHFLHGCGHRTQILLSVKSYPLLQLKHLVTESEHVLQFESHLAQVLLEVK